MNRSLSVLPKAWLCVAAALLLAATPVLADPPTRAARLSFVSGSASFSPSGSDEWLQARINRPLWIGDRLWSGDGRVELQLGGASLRLAPQTLLQILNFDDRIAQFEVTQGNVALHVRAIDRDDVVEIDTPSFAFVTREEGDYRIDVERDHTAVSTRRGNADIYGQDVAYRIDRRERFAFYSPDLRDYDAGPLPPADGFDRWNRERSRREDQSTSSRYVSPELVGFVDLDSHGEWRTDPSLGNVWIPRVAADWAPYRYGHWSWIDPWGWTWIDDAPWGFAPSHYGRWTQIGRSWAWVPGPRDARPAYSPAMVAWVGGDSFSLTVSSGRTRGVGWFPLAPGEVWRPSYEVSRDYFTRVNVSNTVVNNTTIVNVYNNRDNVRISNADYRFRATRAAVTAVPVETFVQGRPVQLTQAQLNANAAAQANVLQSAPARPVRQSIVGPAPRAQAKPPAEAVQRPVVARTAPPAVMPSIEQRTALVREGTPVTREALERGRAQQGGAQAPAAPQAPQAQGNAPVSPAPAASASPPQRSNVRVVDADKAPKPLPEGDRAARGDNERGKGRAGAGRQPGGPEGPAAQAGSDRGARDGAPPAQAARPGAEPAPSSPAAPVAARPATPAAAPTAPASEPGGAAGAPASARPTPSPAQAGRPAAEPGARATPPANQGAGPTPRQALPNDERRTGPPGARARDAQSGRPGDPRGGPPTAPTDADAPAPRPAPAPPGQSREPEGSRAPIEPPGRGRAAPAAPSAGDARPASAPQPAATPPSPANEPRAAQPRDGGRPAQSEARRGAAERPAANRSEPPPAPAASAPPAAAQGRSTAAPERPGGSDKAQERGRERNAEPARAQPAPGAGPGAAAARNPPAAAAPSPRPPAAKEGAGADRPQRANQPPDRGEGKGKDDDKDDKEKGKGRN